MALNLIILTRCMALVSNWFIVWSKQDKLIHYCFKWIAYFCAPLPSVFSHWILILDLVLTVIMLSIFELNSSNEHEWFFTSFVILALCYPYIPTSFDKWNNRKFYITYKTTHQFSVVLYFAWFLEVAVKWWH